MWKKIMVAVVALLGTCSIVFAMEQQLFSASNIYSGGDVTGRIGIKPTSITGSASTIGFQKGDKISMKAIDWILIRKDNYTDYGCTLDTVCPSMPSINAWLSFTTTLTESKDFPSITSTSYFTYSNPAYNQPNAYAPYSLSNVYTNMAMFTERIKTDNNIKIIAPRNLTYLHELYNKNKFKPDPNAINQESSNYYLYLAMTDPNSRSEFGQSAFLPQQHEYSAYSSYPSNPLNNTDFLFEYDFTLGAYMSSSPDPVQFSLGKVAANDSVPNAPLATLLTLKYNEQVNIRAGVYLNLENIVFATSEGTTNGLATIKVPVLNDAGYNAGTKLLTTAMSAYKPMKARILDTNIKIKLDDVLYHNSSARKIVTGTTFDLTYSGGTTGTNHTTSMIVLDDNNNFRFYQQLGSTNVSGTYQNISTANIPKGKYKVYLVNEVVTSEKDATTSSAMSGGIEIEIVDELITSYTPTSSSYTYKSNVNVGNVVGNYYLDGGANSVTYTIKDDTSIRDRIPSGYLNFVFNNSTSSSTGNTPIHSENVLVKQNGPDVVDGSLKVGKYCFILEAKDKSGASKTTPICLNVTPASQSISFANTNERAEKLVNGKAVISNETAVAGATGNGPITYAITGSSPSGIASIHAATGEISATAPGTISVTASRIDPNGNYTNATAVKDFRFYTGVDGTFTQKVTPLHQGDAAAKANSSIVIASIANVSGGIGTIRYTSFVASLGGSDVSNRFRMDSSGNITALQDIAYGTYDFEVTLEDGNGPPGQSIVSGKLVVGLESNSTFSIIATNNQITQTFSDAQTTPIQLTTQGKKGNGTVHYERSASSQKDPDETSEAISVSDSGEISANRAMTSKDTYIVQAYVDQDEASGLAKQVSQEVVIQITKNPQTISFDASTPTSIRFVDQERFAINATLTRSDSSIGALTYKSKTPDICLVDDAQQPVTIMIAKGTCRVTAENTDKNYEEVIETKDITIYEGITGSFTQLINPLAQGSQQAQKDSLIGKVIVSGGDGTYHYIRVEAELNGNDVSSYFQIDTSGNITPNQNLGYGTYALRIVIQDGNGIHGQVEIDGTLQVALEKNDAFKLTYDGSIASEIQSDYVSAKTIPIVVNTQGKKGAGSVHFALSDDTKQDPKESDPAIEIDSSTGIISVHRAMSEHDIYKVYAYVEQDRANGLERQVSQEVNIRIVESPQRVAFLTSVPSQVKYELDKTFDVSGEVIRSDGSSGAITYSSSTPAICIVEDETKPIASMKATGNCVIKAFNHDQNYEEAFDVTSIAIYDGLRADFMQVIHPLKQGDAALQSGSETTIAKIINLAGEQGTVQYALSVKKDSVDVSNAFQINTDGEISVQQSIGYGIYDMLITIQDSTGIAGQSIVSGTLTIALEENNNFFITYKGNKVTSISETYHDAQLGMSVSNQGKKGPGFVHYALSADSQKDSSESSEALSVSDSGVITVYRPMRKKDVYKVYAYVDEDNLNGYAKQVAPSVEILIQDATMPTMNYLVDGNSVSLLETTYSPNGSHQLDIDGKPTGSTISYELVMDNDGKNNGVKVDDVIELVKDGNGNTTGKVNIVNANKVDQIGNVQIIATISCPGYSDTTLTPLNVQIEQAEQHQFRFAQSVYQMPNGQGMFSPRFQHDAPHDDGITFNHKLRCDDAYDVRVDPDDPSTFLYNVDDVEGATITIKARNLGNRNYKAKEASATLRILKAGEQLFDVNVVEGRVIPYGGTATLEPMEEHQEEATYTYASLDSSILSADTDKANVFHAVKIGIVQIEVTKHVSGKADATTYVNMKVNPKPVQVSLKGSYAIKTGEAIPAFEINPFANGEILPGDDITPPSIQVEILNTFTPGNYPILVNYPQNEVNENYAFIQTSANLVITQDSPIASWMIVYLNSTDPEPAESLDLNQWYNEDMKIKVMNPNYDQIRLANTNRWQNELLWSDEGNNIVDLTFQNSTTSAFTSNLQTRIKIDKTKPYIVSIGKQKTNQNAFAKFMNVVSFGTFLKPDEEVIIQAEDKHEKEDIEVSGLASIHYTLSSIEDGVETIVKEETITPSETGQISIPLGDVGTYRVCAVARDHAGNASNQDDNACQTFEVRKIDVDVDNDKQPDFNDPDGDGCPDLNIKWQDEEGNWIKLNVETNYDGIPDVNIDALGEGKASLNIDSDHDGKPDLNLVELKKEDWNPSICVSNQPEQYCTGTKVSAKINIVANQQDESNPLRYFPIINIDNDGDMKADINICKDWDTKPYLNIVKFHDWEPITDYKTTSFTYDSIHIEQKQYKRKYNIDTDEDGLADVNLDVYAKDEPVLNIDTDGDEIPDIQIDSIGDGKADMNIDYNGDGFANVNVMKLTSWIPDKNVSLTDFSYDTMQIKGKPELEDNGIVVENPQGEFLPNCAIKVRDVSDSIDQEIKQRIMEHTSGNEVKTIFEILYLQDDITTQPNGFVKIKIPVTPNVINPKFVIEQKDGSFNRIETVEKAGFHEFETDYVGKVSVLGDVLDAEEPDETPTLTPTPPSSQVPPQSISKEYNTQSVGGAFTGDKTKTHLLLCMILMSCISILVLRKKDKQK